MEAAETVEMAEWREVLAAGLHGTVLTLGAADSGKSTLVRWLAARLSAAGEPVAWLDADVGQSTLGLPATMNVAFPPPAAVMPPPAATFFVGATSPRGHLLPAVVGLFRLRERALAAGAATVLIDSSGFIAAATGGGALKEWEIELLRPAAVIAVQREEELEHLLGPLRRRADIRLHVIPVSPHVRPRSPAARGANRQQRFRAYFAAAAPLWLPLRRLPIYGREKMAPGRLVGLLDGEGFAVGVGVLLQQRPGWVAILTPCRDAGGVAALRLGDLRVDPETGAEAP